MGQRKVLECFFIASHVGRGRRVAFLAHTTPRWMSVSTQDPQYPSYSPSLSVSINTQTEEPFAQRG